MALASTLRDASIHSLAIVDNTNSPFSIAEPDLDFHSLRNRRTIGVAKASPTMRTPSSRTMGCRPRDRPCPATPKRTPELPEFSASDWPSRLYGGCKVGAFRSVSAQSLDGIPSFSEGRSRVFRRAHPEVRAHSLRTKCLGELHGHASGAVKAHHSL